MLYRMFLIQSNENNTKESSAYGPVVVMVFYEALCPDSKYFILKQLQPAFYKAPALIDFQLIPYGKATVNCVYQLYRRWLF